MATKSWIFRWKRQSIGKSILGLFGLLLIAAFPIGFLFAGWVTVGIRCEKTETAVGHSTRCVVLDRHLLGLYARAVEADGVTGIEDRYGLMTTSSHSGSGYGRKVDVDGIILLTDSGDEEVSMTMTSNVNEIEKKRLVRDVEAFLNDTTRTELDLSMDFHNVFGYVGWIGFVFILWLLWKMVWGMIFPQRIDVDGDSGIVTVRTCAGVIRSREIPIRDISDVVIVSGDAAFALAFPKLAKFGVPSGANTKSKVSDSIVLRLVSGEEIGIPNFADASKEELGEIVSAVSGLR